VASDSDLAALPVPLLALDDIVAIADFIIAHCRLKAK
jgi:hypothetical protein